MLSKQTRTPYKRFPDATPLSLKDNSAPRHPAKRGFSTIDYCCGKNRAYALTVSPDPVGSVNSLRTKIKMKPATSYAKAKE